eukprot:Em0021g46a
MSYTAKSDPEPIVTKRATREELSFTPSSCPEASYLDADKSKRAGSITDVRRPMKPLATKKAHQVAQEVVLGVPRENTRITQMTFSPTSHQVSNVSDSSQWEGTINGHYLSMNEDFENVESPYGNENGTAEYLHRCKRTVLFPYLTLQKMIGWRRLFSGSHDLEVSKLAKFVNCLYPALFFVILLYTSVAQLLTCFFRTDVVSNTNTTLTCSDKLVTLVFLLNGVLLTVYLWGVYLFLYLEPEYLSSLMEKVFISCSSPILHTKLTRLLQLTLICGVVWIIFSFVTSIMRMFSLNLLGDIVIYWLSTDYQVVPDGTDLTYDVRRYILVISALFGFVFFDLLYISVVIYYISQAQLIIYLLRSIKDKVRNKVTSLGEAVKDIHYTHSILHIFNGQLSAMMSLCLFIFVVNAITSYMNLLEVMGKSDLAYAVGSFNIIQWSVITVGPIFQAARLTRECRQLKRLGLEIAARPYTYSDTPQKTLDSFLLYTNTTNYSAKLVGVPIYPKYIVLGLFVFGLFLSFYKFPLTWWF